MGFAVQQMIFSNEYFTGDFGSVTDDRPDQRVRVGRRARPTHPERYFVVCLGVFVIAA